MKIQTERLILRDLKKGDEKAILENISNLNVSKCLLSVPYPYTKKDALWWVNHCLEQQKEKPRKSYEFGLCLKEGLELIGGVGLSRIDSEQGIGEIGYWLGEKYWRQGYGFEACKALINFAFKKLKLRKIKIPVFADNEASNGLARKLGFKLEGMLKKQCISKSNKQIHDENLYGLLRENWRKS